jgi:hypothetical protein
MPTHTACFSRGASFRIAPKTLRPVRHRTPRARKGQDERRGNVASRQRAHEELSAQYTTLCVAVMWMPRWLSSAK